VFFPWSIAFSTCLIVIHNTASLKILTAPFRVIGEHKECDIGHTLTDISHALVVVVQCQTAHKRIHWQQIICPTNVDKSTIRHRQNLVCYALRLLTYGIPQSQFSTNKFRIKVLFRLPIPNKVRTVRNVVYIFVVSEKGFFVRYACVCSEVYFSFECSKGIGHSGTGGIHVPSLFKQQFLVTRLRHGASEGILEHLVAYAALKTNYHH